ncbi:MAG: sigma 54-interacting transcriptional regulator [Nitrospinota bacterium]
MTLSIVILMGLATGLLSSAENRITVFSALFGLVTIYLLAAFLFFTRLGYALPVLPPLMTVPLCSIMTSLYLLKIAHKRVGMLTEEKEELMLEFESVTSQLSNKEAQIAHLQDDLGDLRDQVLQDHKQEADQNNKIVDLESKIRQIVQERDFLKNKKDLLDQKLADLEIKEPEKLNLNSAELNQLKEECASFGIITANKKLLEAFRLLKKAAAVKSPVLILGEAGTGKELFASAVHRLSRRKERSLVTLNLPAITETLMESELFGHKKGAFTGANDNKIGKFEQAEGGSIFLDEIGEMKLELQSKLLRVLQTGEIDPVGGKTKKVDVRVIAATNKNLKQEVEKGSFRLDLFSRLNVITLTLPPLSERPEDVELLTNFYIQYFNQANERNITGVSEKAMEALKRYQWKGGNIRELRNTIDRGTIFAEGNLITEKDLNLAQDTPSERPPLKPVIQHQSADVSGDGAFLDLMRQKGFEINSVAGELKQSRGTVAARFKGICFHFLAEGRLDVSIAAKSVAGDEQKHELIERKILGYYKNLENICKDFSEKQGAIEECTKRFKNMPQAYHPALQEVINLHFKERK